MYVRFSAATSFDSDICKTIAIQITNMVSAPNTKQLIGQEFFVSKIMTNRNDVTLDPVSIMATYNAITTPTATQEEDKDADLNTIPKFVIMEMAVQDATVTTDGITNTAY